MGSKMEQSFTGINYCTILVPHFHAVNQSRLPITLNKCKHINIGPLSQNGGLYNA